MSGMQKIGWYLIKDYFLEWESKSETKSLKVNSDELKLCKIENQKSRINIYRYFDMASLFVSEITAAWIDFRGM